MDLGFGLLGLDVILSDPENVGSGRNQGPLRYDPYKAEEAEALVQTLLCIGILNYDIGDG